MRRLLGAAAALLLAVSTPAVAAAPALVFLDNDFLGPGGSNIQSVLPLLRRPDVQVLGIGVVTGDAWLPEETAHLLRFLEIAGRTDIPVLQGALMPLLRTQAEMHDWEARYGRIPWKGAWNAPRPGRSYHPDQPELIPPLPEGTPVTRPSDADAVSFLIRSVRAHPHAVTIIAAGPLTNIALALRIAPDLAGLAKQLVFMGGLIDTGMGQVTGNADYNSDFNVLFDPEAAHIVLSAPWARVTAIGNVATGIVMTPELVERISRAGTPVSGYVARFARRGQPFWDEIATAVAVDPSLIRQDVVASMDVDLQPGPDYGRAVLRRQSEGPAGGTPVHVVQSIDETRFLAGLVAAAR
jgi:inosine-uridine nucleoside N-ribohydrolase